MKNKLYIPLISFLFLTGIIQAQERVEEVMIDGHVLQQLITEEGDTILIANLDDVSITSPREFENREDYLLYMKYRKYANIVFPYAKEAIRIFRETEYATTTMKKRARNKYIKQLQKELKEEFEDPLKDLTRTQGMILTKMIERELDTPMYDLLKSLRGGMTASYWSSISRFYGYNLKEGYIIGEDPILDAVLEDFDVSYRLLN
ncbi:MAG: DUF4294 domain-containing protein [Saprospiraceae bacterium]|nr:DUF4294 domain-containing protein [Saprospiraceae bacterium]